MTAFLFETRIDPARIKLCLDPHGSTFARAVGRLKDRPR
jgi:hypothetical protein